MDGCKGCILSPINGIWCGSQENNKDNLCPCAYCIVRAMCQSYCEDWWEWLLKGEE